MGRSANFDARAFKTAIREQWDDSAKGWSDNTELIRTWLQLPTDAMLAMADLPRVCACSMLQQAQATKRSTSRRGLAQPARCLQPIFRRQS